MLADARSTLRNSLSDFSSPRSAIAPMFQITRRPASTLVVIARRRRPRLCSAATSATSWGVTRFSISFLSGHESMKLSPVDRSSKMSAAVIVVMEFLELRVVARAEECVGRDQCPDAGARDDGEFGALAGLRPAGEDTRREGAVGATARHREPWALDGGQHALEVGAGIAPHARVRDAGDDCCRLILCRERRACRWALRGLLAFLGVLLALALGIRGAGVERQGGQGGQDQRAGEGDARSQACKGTDRMHRDSPINSRTAPQIN